MHLSHVTGRTERQKRGDRNKAMQDVSGRDCPTPAQLLFALQKPVLHCSEAGVLGFRASVHESQIFFTFFSRKNAS